MLTEIEKCCVPSILQYIGHVSLNDYDAIGGQLIVFSQAVQLGAEHGGCKGAEVTGKFWVIQLKFQFIHLGGSYIILYYLKSCCMYVY